MQDPRAYFWSKQFDSKYCPKSPNHKHTTETIYYAEDGHELRCIHCGDERYACWW